MGERGFERATVKFFNEDKGWGFLSRSGKSDVFVHTTTLKKCGVMPEEIYEGRDVEVLVSDGKPGKGPQVETLRLV